MEIFRKTFKYKDTTFSLKTPYNSECTLLCFRSVTPQRPSNKPRTQTTRAIWKITEIFLFGDYVLIDSG